MVGEPKGRHEFVMEDEDEEVVEEEDEEEADDDPLRADSKDLNLRFRNPEGFKRALDTGLSQCLTRFWWGRVRDDDEMTEEFMGILLEVVVEVEEGFDVKMTSLGA